MRTAVGCTESMSTARAFLGLQDWQAEGLGGGCLSLVPGDQGDRLAGRELGGGRE
jgi:hypothetical protein